MSSWWKKKGKLSIDEVVTIGIKIIKLLSKLHSLGWIHRDVKPDNLAIGLKEKNKIIYLFDFGLAKKISDPLPA